MILSIDFAAGSFLTDSIFVHSLYIMPTCKKRECIQIVMSSSFHLAIPAGDLKKAEDFTLKY